MEMKKERKPNIELLRILAIMGVIVLHYNNPMIGGGIIYTRGGSLNSYILYCLESLFVCAVNLFMLISGYFMCESKKRNLWKPLELIVQVIIFREGLYFACVIVGAVPFSIKTMIAMLLPANYFVILYCVVFVLSPFINVMIEHLSQKAFRTLTVSLVLLFAVYPTIIDVIGELRGEAFTGLSSVGMYGSQWGYTIVNFLLMYIIGAYLRKGNSKIQTWSTWKLIAGLCICVLLMIAWAKLNDKVGFFTERSAWEYCNPLVIAEAVIVFCLFSRINLRTNKAINKLASAVFTVFLLHNAFVPHLMIEKFVTGNPILMVAHVITCMLLIYMVCYLVHLLYHLITDPIFIALSKRIKLPVINVED